MENFLFILSSIGIINSFLLIIYFFLTPKGEKRTNIIFAGLIFSLTIRVWKSVLLVFSEGFHDFILNFGLSGFLAVGPLFYLLHKSILSEENKFSNKDYFHLIPAVTLVFLWIFVVFIRDNSHVLWVIFYRLVLLHFITYLSISYFILRTKIKNHSLQKQLELFSGFLFVFWLTYFLNDLVGTPYLGGAIVYSGFIYLSFYMIFNRGFLINWIKEKKYKKTGLTNTQLDEYELKLKEIFSNHYIYRDNKISLPQLAEKLNVGTHIISQVINERFKMSFYELIADYRIIEAEKKLVSENDKNVSEIAFEVGFNSLSAFNKAFKKKFNKTPTQYRNEISNEN